jgi:hypothetical protein
MTVQRLYALPIANDLSTDEATGRFVTTYHGDTWRVNWCDRLHGFARSLWYSAEPGAEGWIA